MSCLWFCAALAFLLATSSLNAAPTGAATAKKRRVQQLLESRDVRSGDPAKRAAAWLAVRDTATKRDLPALVHAAQKHRSSHVRRLAAEVLGVLGDESAITTLCAAAANDHAHDVRRAAAYALGVLGSRDAADTLRGMMTSDKVANNRKRAAASMRLIMGARAKAELQKALAAEGDSAVRTTLEWCINPPPRRTLLPQPKPGDAVGGVCKGTRYQVYTPKQYVPTRTWPVLVSVHGSDGKPDKYMEMCLRDAERHGVVIIAPWFDFPTFDHWGPWSLRHLGMPRADLVLLDIIADVRKRLKIDAEGVMLYGHSQGGQFVHRFVLAHPSRVSRAAAAAPGGVVLPNTKVGFPLGTGPNPRFPDLAQLDYAAFVQTELAIIVGEKDDKQHHELAKRLVAESKRYASAQGVPCRVEHMIVPRQGHGGRNNYLRAGSAFLFGRTRQQPVNK